MMRCHSLHHLQSATLFWNLAKTKYNKVLMTLLPTRPRTLEAMVESMEDLSVKQGGEDRARTWNIG